MKKSKKKLFVIIPVIVVVIAGIIFGVIMIRNNLREAYVMPVANLDNSYAAFDVSYQGTVYESAEQKYYLDAGSTVAEVYVKEGQKINKGDKLFSYDTTLLELDVQEKQLSLNICERTFEIESDKLEEYKNIIPVEETVIVSEEHSEAQTQEGETQNTVVSTDIEEDPENQENNQETVHQTYTGRQKLDLINEQEIVIKKAQNALDFAKEELKEAQQNLEKATQVSNIGGTVTMIRGKDDILNDGSPFCTVQGDNGVTVKGYLGEFDKNVLGEGDKITVSSYMTGIEVDAEIVLINDYPYESSGNMMNGGNQNTSVYEFTAFLEDSTGFEVGEGVEITKHRDNPGALCIEKVYVRNDSNGSYVLIDKDGVLARQDVKIERAGQDEYVLITEGLSGDELIAFPYGSKAEVGIKTTTEEKYSLF